MNQSESNDIADDTKSEVITPFASTPHKTYQTLEPDPKLSGMVSTNPLASNISEGKMATGFMNVKYVEA